MFRLLQMKQHISNKRGNSSIILVLIVTLFICLLSLTVDAGYMYLEQSKLQNAVDAASLAGIAKYNDGADKILEETNRFAALNGVQPESLNISIADGNRKLTVTATKKVDLYFAKVFDVHEATIKVKASAIAAPIVAVKGIRPLAVEQQEFVVGQSYVLKRGGGDGYCGNYGALALGGSGAANYRHNLKYGYNDGLGLGDIVDIGDEVDTEPGNMAGPTLEGVTYILNSDTHVHDDLSKLEVNCPRLIKIPIVDSLSVPGRKTVQIVGFAQFFLEDVVDNDGKTEVRGKFVRKLGEGTVDANGQDFGFYGIKLVE